MSAADAVIDARSGARTVWRFGLDLTRHAARLLQRQWESDRERGALWLVVALGTGIALYFSLSFEPAPAATATALAGALGFYIRQRTRAGIWRGAAFALLALVGGFAAADLRSLVVRAPVLARPLGPVAVQGEIVSRVFDADGGGKIVMDVAEVARLDTALTPRKIRLTVRSGLEVAAPGTRVSVIARLMPPPGPVAPGAFDFARKAYFEGIGAVGFAYGRPQLVMAPATRGLSQRIARLREVIAARVGAVVPDPAGGVAVALMTGLRGAIPQQADDDLRASGLTHLLSISGLHVSLVALAIFGTLRLLLVLSEFIALRVATKKWAAAATIVALGAYVEITGASIPAERAYIMTALVLFAVIVDRRALTLRNIALAGGLVLIALPESLLDVSFQMSFAATLALVAAFEHWNRRRRATPRPQAYVVLAHTGDYIGGLILTSLVAGVATAPFSAYHFQTIALYGLLSNMIAVPLTGLVVMPALLVSFILMPLGLEGPALWVARLGIDGVLATAAAVAHLPGAVVHVKAGPMTALALIAFGGLWLCLWQARWRLLSLAFIAAGLLCWVMASPPDILISRDLASIAVKGRDGRLMAVAGNPSAFDAAMWTKRLGLGDAEMHVPEGLRCDAIGCALVFGTGRRLNISRSPASLEDDCRVADILISTGRVHRRCDGPALVIDRLTVLRSGALAIWDRNGHLTLRGAGGEQGGRLWSPQRPPRRDGQYLRMSPTRRP